MQTLERIIITRALILTCKGWFGKASSLLKAVKKLLMK